MRVDEIRDGYLKFFEKKGHRIYPSDSLVPRNDPSLLFTGAGMNQFKEEFLGRVKDTKRAATCQKCLRTGDLENVGKTAGHHTFFEMLGNFSFGDYFKKDAILWAWEFLTRELGIKENDLWISVYKDDKETYGIWADAVKIPESKILKLGEKENFWPSNAPSVGPDGPCGPCSEIFFGGPDGVEIWNLVFTQFDRKANGALEPLPNKNIDTGMGLERIARVLQGKDTNFEIDSFQPIIDAIKKMAEIPLTLPSPLGGEDKGEGQKVNAIADHIRAVVFAISDGVLPSNEERGYVIRKLIRKAFWYGRGIGLDKPFLYKIAPIVAQVMKRPYPELIGHRENISQIVMEEEKRFKNTLDDGLNRLKEMLKGSKNTGVLRGGDVFKLYDTYGFPLELTQEIAGSKNIEVDIKGYEALMDNQRSISKQGTKIVGSIFNVEGNINIELPGIAPFIEGEEEIDTQALQIVSGGALRSEIGGKAKGSIFLKETNFYGEKGGQVGDKGELLKDGKTIAVVVNAIDVAGRTQHEIEMIDGVLKAGDKVTAKVDIGRRLDVKKNHTATHILHNALRNVLGLHVKQAGSMVAPEKLRFDFTHFRAVTGEELSRIEDIVNEGIRKDSVVRIDELSMEEARKKDAIALFGEKYGDFVRMVSVGDYSKELCGGTHVARTGEIGVFKVISESSIASGTRRIEAVTGRAAYEKIKEEENLLKEAAKELNVKPEAIAGEIERLANRLKQLEKSLEGFIDKNADINAEKLLNDRIKIKDKNIIIGSAGKGGIRLLKKASDIIKERLGPEKSIFALIAGTGAGVYMVIGTNNLAKAEEIDSSEILKKIGAEFNLKGGGRADFAQGGCPGGQDFFKILNKAKEEIMRYL